MKLLTSVKFRVGLLCVLILTALLPVVWQMQHASGSTTVLRNNQLPKDGLTSNDTNGTVPGDPQNGVRVLKRLYALQTVYKRLHHVPQATISQVIDDVLRNPKAYSFADLHDYKRQMANPDNRFADMENIRKHPDVPVTPTVDKRPDGTALFGPKKTGTRDVLACSTTYVHQNARQFPGYHTTLNPVGFYQILWEDGTIEQIPYDKVLYVQTSAPGARQWEGQKAFPGQAGVPDNALTYDQYWTQVAKWKQAPRGIPGGKGVSFNGKSYR